MAAVERKAGRGYLAKARKKSQRAPEYRGLVTIGGVEYHLSGWVATDQFNREYVSLAVSEREAAEPVGGKDGTSGAVGGG